MDHITYVMKTINKINTKMNYKFWDFPSKEQLSRQNIEDYVKKLEYAEKIITHVVDVIKRPEILSEDGYLLPKLSTENVEIVMEHILDPERDPIDTQTYDYNLYDFILDLIG